MRWKTSDNGCSPGRLRRFRGRIAENDMNRGLRGTCGSICTLSWILINTDTFVGHIRNNMVLIKGAQALDVGWIGLNTNCRD